MKNAHEKSLKMLRIAFIITVICLYAITGNNVLASENVSQTGVEELKNLVENSETVNSTTSSDNATIVQERKACKEYNKLVQNYDIEENNSEKIPDYYGGAFINENDELVVEVTENTEQVVQELQKITGDQTVGIMVVKRSYNELLNVYQTIVDSLTESDVAKLVSSCYVDEKNNCVTVKINNIQAEEEIRNTICDADCLNFVVVEGTIQADATLKPGSYVTIGDYGYSIGFRCIRMTESGSFTNGFISAAHGNSVGSAAYTLAGSYIGKVLYQKYSDNVDASYIRLLNTDDHTLSNLIKYSGSTLTEGSYMSTVPVGYTVYKVGNTTGLTTGEVVSNNCSVTYNGIVFSDFICTSCASQSGDSGGLVYADNNGSYSIVGIHVAHNNDTGYGYCVKYTNISDALNLILY
ncbi:MAG: S1 family peptidase [Clostridiaceae bacterium]|nr:S1 family peptidase [Clostridiaceae bacterium]